MTRVASLLTVQVGAPKRYPLHHARGGDERSWETSFFREPSPERRWLHTTHLDGNTQADTKNHGSPSQAVLLYAAAHYPLWGTELGRPEIGPGGLGEELRWRHLCCRRSADSGERGTLPVREDRTPSGCPGACQISGEDRTYRLVLSRPPGGMGQAGATGRARRPPLSGGHRRLGERLRPWPQPGYRGGTSTCEVPAAP